MTSGERISQGEIIKQTKNVLQGLEILKSEHDELLDTLQDEKKKEKEEERTSVIRKSLEEIEIGIVEAQFMMSLCNHLSTVSAEKQKLKAHVRRLCQENAWLRQELSTTLQKLKLSEQSVVQLEEEKKHLEYMNTLKIYDEPPSYPDSSVIEEDESLPDCKCNTGACNEFYPDSSVIEENESSPDCECNTAAHSKSYPNTTGHESYPNSLTVEGEAEQKNYEDDMYHSNIRTHTHKEGIKHDGITDEDSPSYLHDYDEILAANEETIRQLSSCSSTSGSVNYTSAYHMPTRLRTLHNLIARSARWASLFPVFRRLFHKSPPRDTNTEVYTPDMAC